MKIVLEDTREFVRILENINTYCFEIQLKLFSDYIYTSMFSDDGVDGIILNINKNFFKEYIYNSDTEAGIKLDDFIKIIKSFNKNLSIEITDDKILFNSLDSNIKKSAVMSKLVIQSEKYDLPLKNLPNITSSVKINTDKFKEVISDALSFEYLSISFKLNKQELKILSEDTSKILSKYNIWFSSSDIFSIIQKPESEISVMFGIEHIKGFLKNIIDDNIAILFSASNEPIHIKYTRPNIELELLLAPRIEEEDEIVAKQVKEDAEKLEKEINKPSEELPELEPKGDEDVITEDTRPISW